MSGHVYVYECQARYAGEGQRTPCRRRVSPSTMGLWEQTQVIWLGSKRLCLPSHPAPHPDRYSINLHMCH